MRPTSGYVGRPSNWRTEQQRNKRHYPSRRKRFTAPWWKTTRTTPNSTVRTAVAAVAIATPPLLGRLVTHQHTGGSVSKGAVGDVRVSRDPPDVRRTPVDILGLVVKHQFEGGGSVEHVTADGVENPLENPYQGQSGGIGCDESDRAKSRPTLGFPVEPLV